MPDELFAVSDLHLSPPGALNNFHAGPQLVRFVDALPAGAVLAVAGDFFDFLQLEDRPPRLDLAGAPELVATLLARLRREAWGAELFPALGRFIDRGGRAVVVPGNHDPELLHPRAAALLRDACGLSGEDQRLTLHPGPWNMRIGDRRVIVGHGHRADPWNHLDPVAVGEALAEGRPTLPLPPGSELVLRTLRAFKEARDPETGQPRFTFIDLLKPETPWVPLLLLYLDPGLTLRHLPGSAGPAGRTLLGAVHRCLRGGPTLVGDAGTPPDAGPRPAVELLAEAIVDGLEEAERAAPRAVLAWLEAWLDSAAPEIRPPARDVPAAPDTLASHRGARRLLCRIAVRRLREESTFFDPAATGPLDRAVIAEHLAGAEEPTVVICGHTHAARETALAGDRTYLNTGTWTDLIAPPRPADEAALTRWIDALERGDVERRRRLSYAHVTADAVRLETWDEPASG